MVLTQPWGAGGVTEEEISATVLSVHYCCVTNTPQNFVVLNSF